MRPHPWPGEALSGRLHLYLTPLRWFEPFKKEIIFGNAIITVLWSIFQTQTSLQSREMSLGSCSQGALYITTQKVKKVWRNSWKNKNSCRCGFSITKQPLTYRTRSNFFWRWTAAWLWVTALVQGEFGALLTLPVPFILRQMLKMMSRQLWPFLVSGLWCSPLVLYIPSSLANMAHQKRGNEWFTHLSEHLSMLIQNPLLISWWLTWKWCKNV